MILRRSVPGRLAVAALVAASVAMVAATQAAAAPFTSSARFPNLGSGRIWSLAVSPGDAHVVLAGTDAGVYRSADGGATWAQTTLSGVRVWTVGFDARAPHAAYAGTDGQGVASSPNGVTWSSSGTGLTDQDVRVLAFGLEGIAAGTHSGVDVSSDGRHWRSAGLDGYSVSALVVSANQPQLTLVAGTDGSPPHASSSGFLFRNTGGGLKWDTLQQGLPASTFVSSLAVGPLPATGQPRPLAVTTTKGAYHSGDGGTTWTSSSGVPDQTNLTTTGFSPIDPNLVYAGADVGGSSGGVLMRSTDAGATFAPLSDALPDGHRNADAIAVSPTTPPTILVAVNPAGKPSTVYRGNDGTAPTPAGTGQESAGAALSSAPPTPVPTPHARATPARRTAPPSESTGLRHVLEVAVRFPFPLTLELLLILVIVYVVLRWRQRYLDIEGPP